MLTRRTRGLVLAAAMSGIAGLALAPIGASALSWSGAIPLNTDVNMQAVACPSTTLCVASDQNGDLFTTSTPAGDVASDWNELKDVDTKGSVTGISCASISLCVAIDSDGGVLVSTNPAGTSGGTANWTRTDIITSLTGISCAVVSSTPLCVASGYEGGVSVSTDPVANNATDWTSTALDAGHGPFGVSCVTTLCVLVDDAGNALTPPIRPATARPIGRRPRSTQPARLSTMCPVPSRRPRCARRSTARATCSSARARRRARDQ